MKYLLSISYNGKQYKGWQIQPDKSTVQSTIEEALKQILRETIKVHSAGRTDAGVHALDQKAHFETVQNIQMLKLKFSVNSLLKNSEIEIKSIEKVEDNFHARFSCKHKTYGYYFYLAHFEDIFFKDISWKVKTFDIEKAKECAALLVGTHDFSSLRDSDCQGLTPIKTIDKIEFKEVSTHLNSKLIKMEVSGKSFLHHQVRIIAGTIYDIIRKEENPERIKEILEAKDRKAAGQTAPPEGLFLEKINY